MEQGSHPAPSQPRDVWDQQDKRKDGVALTPQLLFPGWGQRVMEPKAQREPKAHLWQGFAAFLGSCLIPSPAS